VADEHRPTALVVGSVTRDLEDRGGGVRERPGGVVHYAGLALLRLGARVRVVTRLNPNDADLVAPLRREGAEIRALESRFTTTYRNDYSGPVDHHELLKTSDPIAAKDVPEEWRRADLIQLGPLHRQDLEPEVVGCVSGLVGLDLQGLVRRQARGGVELAPNPKLGDFLARVQVVHANDSEVEAAGAGEPLIRFVEHHGVREMIVTHGPRGARILAEGRSVEIPARPTAGHHLVGAGDVFLATYLYLRSAGQLPEDAAAGAVEVCTLRIEHGEIPRDFRPGTLAR
jgi:sugar/nucleoside kinase (ribokinase family)